jgi:hypothetical protein
VIANWIPNACDSIAILDGDADNQFENKDDCKFIRAGRGHIVGSNQNYRPAK